MKQLQILFITTAVAFTGYCASDENSNGNSNDGSSGGNDTILATSSVAATGKNKTITITWADVTGADSYNIYWAESSGVTTSSGTKIEGVTSPYNHTGLTNSTDYYYIVTAISSSGKESTASSEVTAYPHLSPLKTGQSKCWDDSGTEISCSGTGQDGDHQSGRDADFTGPTQHSTHTGDYTTTDNTTGLVWKTCTEGLSGADCSTGSITQMTWSTATSTTCDALNSANSGNGYAGRTDWQVPTITQLEGIINYNANAPSTYTAKFPATDGSGLSYYWSATETQADNTEVWSVRFDRGGVYNQSKTPNYKVRCVSPGSWSNPTPDYNDNSDGTVTDKATGLTWQQCTKGSNSATDCSGVGTGDLTTWTNALSYCNNLNLAGKSWRLPNVNELKTIVDRTKNSPAINTMAFPSTATNTDYWSSSSAVGLETTAWCINFDDGGVDYNHVKTNKRYVRCVSN